MKKLLIPIALLFSLLSFGQQKNSTLGFLGGVTGKNALGFMANYTYSDNNSNYEFAVQYSMFKDDSLENTTINYSTTTLNIGYLYTALRNNTNSVAVSLGIGVNGGFESIQKPNDNVVLTSENGFTAGAYAVVQSDFYLSDTFALTLRLQENYAILTTTGNFFPFIAGGIKFNL